ncbi:hypothetical protein [Niabella ginsengisoli]|uniref:Uncharacterized protein n=1 Tax=Niabella ginsengisoli TaxID=522298 RepID=A0ABS9SIS1_9BACT|nr:hypothetical protein [Niabella ginsengisoli]MCH5598225.1 hypothetical protein [Niabella ginsengisoli]
MQDGNLVSEDTHESLADKFRGIPYKKNMFLYYLKVGGYKPGAKYILVADVAGEKIQIQREM